VNFNLPAGDIMAYVVEEDVLQLVRQGVLNIRRFSCMCQTNTKS